MRLLLAGKFQQSHQRRFTRELAEQVLGPCHRLGISALIDQFLQHVPLPLQRLGLRLGFLFALRQGAQLEHCRVFGIARQQRIQQRQRVGKALRRNQVAGGAQALFAIMLGLVLASGSEQTADLLVFRQLLVQLGQQREAIFIAAGGEEFASFGESFLFALFGLVGARGLEQSLDFIFSGEFLLQFPQQGGAFLVATRH